MNKDKQTSFPKKKEGKHNKVLKIMKLSAVFLMIATLQIMATGYAQNISVNLNMDKTPMRELFKEIERQTELSFIFSDDISSLNDEVSVNVRNMNIKDVLNQLFKDKDLGYQILNDKLIVIAPKVILQQINVKGTVTDDANEPLPGVNVMVKGTTQGTVTDVHGAYSLTVPDEKAILVFSFIGYISKEIEVGSQTTLNVQMEETAREIEEVVVVGYGTQKKVNLTGAVASVKGDVLETRPVGSVGTGLQGMLPGVTITSSSGQPGNPGISIIVRGINTINSSTAPLILIDGISGGDINLMNPDDIESVTVLKDAASSAIYGARAANGVILVTTKTGKKKEKSSFSYTGYFGLQTPTALPEMVDGRQYMTLTNEAYAAAGVSRPYTDDAFIRYDSKNFPNEYSNTDWIGESFKKFSTQQNHNFNINGGTDQSSYFMSYGYLVQNGLVVGDPYSSKRNNVRLRLKTEVFDRITIDGNLGFVDYYRQDAASSGTGGVFRLVQRISPLLPVKWQQPTADYTGWEDSPYWSYGSVVNPVRTAYESGYAKRMSKTFNGNFNATAALVKGMNVNVQYAYNYWTRDTKTWRPTMPRFAANGAPHQGNDPTRDSVSEVRESTLTQTLNSTFNYETRMNKHGLKFLAGFSQEWAYMPYISASRTNILLDGVEVLDAGVENINNSGYANHWALRSFFGRINYDYAEKYLFEANVRHDGTSRFHKDNRWGTFPSFSAGWRFTEEDFMDFAKPVLSFGKFRVSWGELGNQTIGSNYYPYLVEIERVLHAYPIGGNDNVGFKQYKLPNQYIQWEAIRMFNIGVDLALFNNRLETTFDWFEKNNTNALLQPIFPTVVGIVGSANLPYENIGSIQNRGWELSVSWRDHIGKVHYGLTANIADAKNKITDLGNSPPSGDNLNYVRRVGDPINAYYGYKTDGLLQVSDFENYDEVTKKYTNPKVPVLPAYSSYFQPGDVKYSDISGPDGVPDERIDETDKVIFGDPYPRYSYSLKGFVQWNNFDFQFYLQGVGKVNGYLTEEARHCFINDYSVPKTAHLDRWTPNNAGATYPRMYLNPAHNIVFSDYWLEDASYLRLKNIQLGYTVPKHITGKINVNRVKVYVSIDNLFTFTNYFGAFDPEVRETAGDEYPQVKTFAFGLQVGF